MPARHILVLITGDPMKSARPGEAIRMALGLGSGTHTVSVVLRGRAVALLFPEAEESQCADDWYYGTARHPGMAEECVADFTAAIEHCE